MPESSFSAAQQARVALGRRLLEIRQDAGLKQRELAALAGWQDTKVSKIEHGRQLPSVFDIKVWCRVAKANSQVDELVALLRNVESMWVEWRRMEQTGLTKAQESALPLYQRTKAFRSYSSSFLPGLLQTEAYTRVVLTAIMRRRALPDDIDTAVNARMQRQRLLSQKSRRFAFLLEEAALRVGVGGRQIWTAQLQHLVQVASQPNVSLGIVPFSSSRDSSWPVESFNIFDDVEVNVELVSGYLTVTQPIEMGLYLQAWSALTDAAVFGQKARDLVAQAVAAAR
jgi:transcriptional regulator with XRE-family HTH domain